MPAPDEEIIDTPVTLDEAVTPEPLPVPRRKFKWKKLVRHLLITWLVVITSALITEKVGDYMHMGSEEKQTHLRALNQSMSESLNQMRPVAIAGQFFDRLKQSHGLVFGQWDAPFNAEVAITTLDRRFLERLKPLNGLHDSIESDKLSLSVTTKPVGDSSSDWWAKYSAADRQAKDVQAAIDLQSKDDEAQRSGIQKWEIGKLLPTQGAGSLFAFVFNALLALPDAYLSVTKTLLPHFSWALRVVVVLLVFLTAFIIARRCEDIRAGLWFLFLLPVAVSLLAGLFALVILAFTSLFHPVAPTLTVTGSAAATPFISPFLLWTSGKLVEHHITEGGLHLFPKRWFGE